MTQHPFSPEEKPHIVRQLIADEKYLSQLSREYGVSHTAISKWREAYQSRGESAFFSDSSSERSPDLLEARIADLERFCGQLAMETPC